MYPNWIHIYRYSSIDNTFILIALLFTTVICAENEVQLDLGEVWIDAHRAQLHMLQGDLIGGNFSYVEVKADGQLTVILESVDDGDADLYASTRTVKPGYELTQHELHSTTCGIDRIDLNTMGSSTVYIAVYAHPSKPFTRYRLLIVLVYANELTESSEHSFNVDIPIELIHQLGLETLNDETSTPPIWEIFFKIARFLFEIALEILL